MRQVETLSGAQAPGCAGLDNRIDFTENQLEVLKSSLAPLEQEIAGLSQAQGDHPHGLGELRAGVQSINAKANQADEAVRTASDQLKVLSSKMDQTAAGVVAQAGHVQLQMEEIKAIETWLSQLEASGATNKAADNADPSQVNMLLESLARLEQEHAQYKGATSNTQRRHEEVLRETQNQVVQLEMRILKTEEDSRGLKTGDHVGQLEARIQVWEGLGKNTEGPKTSPAPGPPEGFHTKAVPHVERELVQIKLYFEGQIRTLGQNMNALMAQLREEHLRPRGVNPMDRGYYPDRAGPAPRGTLEDPGTQHSTRQHKPQQDNGPQRKQSSGTRLPEMLHNTQQQPTAGHNTTEHTKSHGSTQPSKAGHHSRTRSTEDGNTALQNEQQETNNRRQRKKKEGGGARKKKGAGKKHQPKQETPKTGKKEKSKKPKEKGGRGGAKKRHGGGGGAQRRGRARGNKQKDAKKKRKRVGGAEKEGGRNTNQSRRPENQDKKKGSWAGERKGSALETDTRRQKKKPIKTKRGGGERKRQAAGRKHEQQQCTEKKRGR